MSDSIPSFDHTKKRPLEIRVLDRSDEGGASEDAALLRDSVTADAFLIIRALIDDGKITLVHGSVEGTEKNMVSLSLLYTMWISMGGYIAREAQETDEESMKIRNFVKKVLALLELNPEMEKLLSPSDASEATPE